MTDIAEDSLNNPIQKKITRDEAKLILIDMLKKGTFTTRKAFSILCGKAETRGHSHFVPWLKENDSPLYGEIKKRTERTDKPSALASAMQQVDDAYIKDLFDKSLASMLQNRVDNKVNKMIDEMAEDITLTKKILMQASMLTVVTYFKQIQAKANTKPNEDGTMPDSANISPFELQNAYKMFKTELGETTQITEHHHTATKVELILPISKDEAEVLLAGQDNVDLSIDVDPKYKDSFDRRLKELDPEALNINKQHGRNQQTEGPGTTTETEEIPS